MKKNLAIVLLILASLMLQLLPAGVAHADAITFELYARSYGPNDSIMIKFGTLTRDCDQVFTTSDIFVVPRGSAVPGANLRDLDPSGTGNTIISPISGNLIENEVIGYTYPSGKIGAGAWDVVEDTCQDGIFNGSDSVLSGGFSVVFPENIADLPTDAFAAVKAEAAEQATRDRYAAAIAAATFILYDVYSLYSDRLKGFDPESMVNFYLTYACTGFALEGILQIPADTEGNTTPITYICPTVGMNDIIKVQLAAIDTLLDEASHFDGIAADPPDPNFAAPAVLAARDTFAERTADPLEPTVIGYARRAAESKALSQALLASLEKYQGADLANAPVQALMHGRNIQQYSRLLADNLEETNTAIDELMAALQPVAADLETLAAGLGQQRDRLLNNGFSPAEVEGLKELGATDEVLNALLIYMQYGPFDTFAQQGGILPFYAGLKSQNSANAAALRSFAGAVEPNLQTLESLRFDELPHPSAGGPYTAPEGTPVTFNASASTHPLGETLTFAWDLDGDGAFDDATGATLTYTYTAAYTGLVGVKVTDAKGRTNVAYAPVTITQANRPPAFTGFTPSRGAVEVLVGGTAEFTATVADPDGDSVALQWLVDGVPAGTGPSFTFTAGAAAGVQSLSVLASDNNPLGGTTQSDWMVLTRFPDADGDGWRANRECNDNDPEVNPGRTEVLFNGKDDDCNPATPDAGQMQASFTIQRLGNNVALAEAGAKVVATSSPNGSSREAISLVGASSWVSGAGQVHNQYLTVELAKGQSYLIDSVRLTGTDELGSLADFEVLVSTDNVTYTSAVLGRLPQLNGAHDFWFQPVTARYVKLLLKNNQAMVKGSTNDFIKLREFEVLTVQRGGPEAQFRDTSTVEGESVSWHWDFGDGATSAEQHPQHTYTQPGLYTVTLAVTNNYGHTVTTSMDQQVLPKPAVKIGLPTAAPKEGDDVPFTDLSTDDGTIIQRRWDFGDGRTAVSPLATNGVRYFDNGTFTITLTVVDNDGITATGSAPLTVLNAPPKAEVKESQTVFWNQAFTIRGIASDFAADHGTLQCTWDMGDGTTYGPHDCHTGPFSTGFVHRYMEPGLHRPALIVTDKDGGTTTANNAVITVQKHVTSVEFLGNRTALAGEQVTLSARVRSLFDGNRAAGQTLSFQVNGQTLTAITGADGIATVMLEALPEGEYPVRVEHSAAAEDRYYQGASWDLDQIRVGVTGEALVSTGLAADRSQLASGEELTLTLDVTGTNPTAGSVPLDMALVMDQSGSITHPDFQRIREASYAMIDMLDRESDGRLDGQIVGSQVTVIPFADYARLGVPFSGDATALKAYIAALSPGGGTNIADGLSVARAEFAHGAKPGNKPVILLMTDGVSRFDPMPQAAAAKAEGVEIFTVGLGSQIDEAGLRKIASAPVETHYYHAPTADQLLQIYTSITAAATGPVATNLVVTAQISSDFVLVPGSVTPAPASVQGRTITWTVPTLRGETLHFAYRLTPAAAIGGGEKPLHSAATVTYTDTQGRSQSKEFDPLHALVSTPSALVYQGPASGMADQPATLAARLTDSGNGQPLANQTLTFHLGAWQAEAVTNAEGVASVDAPAQTPGTYTITVAYAGAPGHLAATTDVPFTVEQQGDTTPPAVSHTVEGTLGQNGWYVSPVTVTLTATDEGAGVAGITYQTASGAPAPYAQPTQLTQDGSTVLTYQAVDQAGNTSPSGELALQIDQTAPTAVVTGPAQAAPSQTLTVDASGSTDATSGIAAYAWDLDADGTYELTGPTAAFVSDVIGSYTVRVQVTDNAGHTGESSVTIHVRNTAPVVSAGPDAQGTEGAALTVTASFADPDSLDTHTATVDWGDGQVEPVTPAGPMLTATHTYPDDGLFTVAITVCDSHGDCGSDTMLVTVQNVAPEASIDRSSLRSFLGQSVIAAKAGINLAFGSSATDPGSDDLTFTWTWGDGTTESRTVPATAGAPSSGLDAATHLYPAVGLYTVQLTVTDGDGGTVTDSMTVLVTGSTTDGPRTIGFWGHQFDAKGRVHVPADTLQQYGTVINALSRVFSETVTLESLNQGQELLTSSQLPVRERAIQQLLAVWLNLAHGGLALDQLVDTNADGAPDMGLEQAISQIEGVLLNPGATDADYEQVKSMADSINNMGH